MVNSGNSFTFRSKVYGQVIAVDDFTEHETALNALATEFNTAVSKKLTLYTPTPAEASLNLPAGVTPTSPATGDLWFNSATSELKFKTASATKTLAFTDSTFTTLSVTSLAVASTSTSFTSTAATIDKPLTVSSTATITGATTVQSNSTSAFLIRSGATSDTNLALLNGTAKTLSLLYGMDFTIYSDGGTTGKFIVDGATGATQIKSTLDVTGAITTGGAVTLTTGSLTLSGSGQSVTASSFKVGSTAYASPALLNGGGFTFVLGNGFEAITADTIDVPVVIIPYACTITALYLYDTSNTTSLLSVKLQKASWATTPSFADLTGATVAFPNPNTTTRIASTTGLNLSLAQNDIVQVRIVTGTTPTCQQAALHVRINRS